MQVVWYMNRARKYLAMRDEGISRKRACIVLGITERTAYRYEGWARTQGE